MTITPLRAWTLVACLAFVFATAYAVAVVLFDGETTLVTAHYHATVGAVAISRVGGLIAMVGAGWLVLNLLRQRER